MADNRNRDDWDEWIAWCSDREARELDKTIMVHELAWKHRLQFVSPYLVPDLQNQILDQSDDGFIRVPKLIWRLLAEVMF